MNNPPRWKRPAIAALAVVNAGLALALVGGTPDLAGDATAAQLGRPSEYLMIPARLTNIGQDIVYIIDTGNGNLTAAAYDRQQGVQFIPPQRLSEAFNQAAAGGNPGR